MFCSYATIEKELLNTNIYKRKMHHVDKNYYMYIVAPLSTDLSKVGWNINIRWKNIKMEIEPPLINEEDVFTVYTFTICSPLFIIQLGKLLLEVALVQLWNYLRVVLFNSLIWTGGQQIFYNTKGNFLTITFTIGALYCITTNACTECIPFYWLIQSGMEHQMNVYLFEQLSI